MERMPYKCPQSVVIASGIFEPKNLKAFNDEIGINSVVEKTMSYDKYNFFQGNARFQSDASNEGPVSGWFVSVYDPQKNKKIHNLNTQHRKKAIVVFIEIACDLFFGETYEVHLNLIPQFINRAHYYDQNLTQIHCKIYNKCNLKERI